MKLCYFIRMPEYPVIVDFDGIVIAGVSESDLIKGLGKVEIVTKKNYDVIDSTGEGWIFTPELGVLSPLSFKKNRTKKDMINLVNNRKNKSENERPYSDRSLSAKRYEIVFNDLIKVLKS